MSYYARIAKPLLALALAGAALAASQGCSRGSAPAALATQDKPRVVSLSVTEKGYEPSPLSLRQGEPVKLVITRTTEQTCATELILQDYDINVALPLNQPVEVSFTPTKAGKLVYGCAMGQMISGVFMVD